jgi:hypothetical protein
MIEQRHHLWIQCSGLNTSRAYGVIASTPTQPGECRGSLFFFLVYKNFLSPPRTTHEAVSSSISISELPLVYLISSLASKQPLTGYSCCPFSFPCLCWTSSSSRIPLCLFFYEHRRLLAIPFFRSLVGDCPCGGLWSEQTPRFPELCTYVVVLGDWHRGCNGAWMLEGGGGCRDTNAKLL